MLTSLLLVTCAFAQAEAAPMTYQCSAIFTPALYEGRMNTLASAITQKFVNASDPSKVVVDSALVQESLEIAKIQLEARGAKTRLITFEGYPALHILAGRDQWGRIANSAAKNHQTQLIFAPVSLARDFAETVYENRSELGRVINVSFTSLSIGPKSERQIQHEFGHMDADTRGLTPFTGYVASFSDNSPIVRGNKGYFESMPLDEVPRNVKDLFMTGLDLSRLDTPYNRERLEKAAIRAREAVLNMSASLSLTNKLHERLASRPAKFSVGPIGDANGDVQENAAHITGNGLTTFLQKVMITVKGKEQPALSLQVQSATKWTEIKLPWNDDWSGRFAGLIEGTDIAVDETFAYLIEELEKREASHRPTITSTLKASHFIAQNPDADAKTLANEAMKPRTDLAPLLVRPPHQQ